MPEGCFQECHPIGGPLIPMGHTPPGQDELEALEELREAAVQQMQHHFDRPVWASDYAHGNLSPEMCAYIERNLPGIPPIKTLTMAALILQSPEPLAVMVMRGRQ